MSPPATGGYDPPPLRTLEDAPARPADPGPGDVLAGLVRVLTRRVARSGADPAVGLEPLREAVEALGHHLDALDLLRAEGIVAGEASPTPAGEAAGAARPDTGRAPNTAGVRLEPAQSPGAARPAIVPDRPAADAAGADASDPRHAPYRDPDTGLLTRDGFDWIAGGELKRCARHGRVFSILLVQVDGAREVVARAAEVVRRTLRGSDVSAREGRRGIAIALPETAPREAEAVARRLVGHLEGAGAWTPEGRVGIAGYPTHGETVWSLLETARGGMASPSEGAPRRDGRDEG